MSKIKNWLHAWLTGGKIESLEKKVNDLEYLIGKYKELIQPDYAADIAYKRAGHLVMLCRVGNQDMVQIFDVPKDYSIPEYERLISGLHHVFGGQISHVDGPNGKYIKNSWSERLQRLERWK